MVSKLSGKKNQLLLNLKTEDKGENFLPYKNFSRNFKAQRLSRSQRSQKAANGKSRNKLVNKSSRSNNVSSISDYSLPNRIPTPVYERQKAKMLQAKKLVNRRKKKTFYNERSRQPRSSGVRSNLRRRKENDQSIEKNENL